MISTSDCAYYLKINKDLGISILEKIETKKRSNKKMLAALIDPDKYFEIQNKAMYQSPYFEGIDFVFVGGSLVGDGVTKKCIEDLKTRTSKPIVIFPGSPNQIDDQADAILLLSLISGRNPALLIGRHVESSLRLQQTGIEILPTGYILIDGGKQTAVAYISGTTPIPQDKEVIAISTALAGVQLGLKLIYLDCGSGAKNHISKSLLTSIRKTVDVPIIVGGGIRSEDEAKEVFASGADIVVVGNKLEEDPSFLEDLVLAKEQFNSSLTQKQ